MVNINKVYQRVLALANKEQRGYITPEEFNIYANQAQLDIFEQYFYDLNQFKRVPGNSTLYGDPIDILEEKIEAFHASEELSGSNNIFDLNNLSGDFYRLARVQYGDNVEIEKLTHSKFMLSRKSPLTSPSLSRPIYYLKDSRLIVNPNTIDLIAVNYIRKPEEARWPYSVVQGKAVFNPSLNTFQNFELHASEETKLVIKILQLSGIALKDNSLYQIAGSEDNKNIQQEKQ